MNGAPPGLGTQAPIRLLIVDDHPMVREGLLELIQSEPDLVVCGAVASRAETLEAVAREAPDLVVLDLSLADCDGTRLLRELFARSPRLRVLVLSTYEEAAYGERCLRAGARGYVNKRAAGIDIRRAIRVVAAGGEFISEEMREHRANAPRRGHLREAVRREEGPDPLSERELDVFRLLGRGKGPSRIAETLGLSVKTVEGYEERIKFKLGLANAAELSDFAVNWYRGVTR